MKTFRVFRHAGTIREGSEAVHEVWHELAPLEGEWKLYAEEVGAAYGAGEYMYFEGPNDEGRTYTTIETLTVVAVTRYEEAEEPDPEDETPDRPEFSVKVDRPIPDKEFIGGGL